MNVVSVHRPNMSPDTFGELVRKGEEKLRVDEIKIETGSEQFFGHGLLLLKNNEFELQLNLGMTASAGLKRIGVFHQSDTWVMTGKINNCLEFKCPGLFPAAEEHIFNETKTFHFHPDCIELIPTGFDALSRIEKEAAFKAINPDHKAPNRGCEVEFHAYCADYKLLFCNGGTESVSTNDFFGHSSQSTLNTFMDSTDNYDFGLINEGSDLHICLRSKSTWNSGNVEKDWNLFEGLQHSIGFVHGKNAWPYRIIYWSNGKKMTDRFFPPNRIKKTIHAPFSSMPMLPKETTGTVGASIKLAAKFFEQNTDLSEKISYLLFMAREAGASAVHFDIRSLALCSVFEKLLDLIFEYLSPQITATQHEQQLFQQAKNEVSTEVKKKSVRQGDPYDRICRILSSMKAVQSGDKYTAIINHFGLKEMSMHFEAWKKERPQLAHGKFPNGQQESRQTEYILNQSRIAGGINILFLKLIGYSGPVVASRFEDIHRVI
ncbi:MAG: hypothetical protein JWQ71_4354 [Pedosphaera sp.]|nr:hypothetical protein [Pedosphaera sp.]